MKLLLDECIPHPLRAHLVGHDCFTVAYMGWDGVKNGRLLALASGAGFEALITTDRNLEYQQNPVNLPVAVVVLEAATNKLEDLLPLVPQVIATLAQLQPRTIDHVS